MSDPSSRTPQPPWLARALVAVLVPRHRMALGGQPAQVRRSVLLDAMRVILAGAAIGIAGSSILARFVGAFLFDVNARDPWLYAASLVLLVGVGLLAAYVPAQRASKVNPVEVLRA